MKDQGRSALQTLIITFLFNAVLLAALFLLVGGPMLDQALFIILIGAVLTFGLWFTVQRVDRRVSGETPPAVPAPDAPALAARPEALSRASEASVLQLLSILQRKGRLVDFLQEDLRGYGDAQIGAAVRTIHEGCKEALDEYVELAPVFSEEEGSEVTIPPGFDAGAIRLVGDVVGDPPFKGSLRHRGWRVVRIDLPERMHEQEKDLILAAAEVEVTA